MPLEFGIWDHFERLADVPVAIQYAQRIELIATAESLGFYGYHVAEHHLSPLSMAPSPLTFLAALSQQTTTIRLGSMVVIIPLYPPIRLAEELCMVDALSNGRLEIGVGRGIRDVEHEWFGRDPSATRDAYAEALEILRDALESGTIRTSAPTAPARFVHEPVQKPGPRFWYVGNLDYAAEQAMSVLSVRPTRDDADQFASLWSAQVDVASPRHLAVDPMFGATRPVYVAATDEAARRVAERAWTVLGDHFWATDTRVAGRAMQRGASQGTTGGDLDVAMANGSVLFGSPERVREVLGEFLGSVGPGFTYLVSGFQWGDITHDEARRSMQLFAEEVAPALRELHKEMP